MSFRKTPLSRKRTTLQRTGQLARSINDQFEKMKHTMATLNPREGVAMLRGVARAFVFRTAEVTEKFPPDEKFAVIEQLKRRLTELHSYFGPADLSPEAELRRLDEFLAEAPAATTRPTNEAGGEQRSADRRASSPVVEEDPFL